MLNLLGKKLGWFESDEFNGEEARQMLAVFPYLLKNKGTIKAVKDAVNAFVDIKQIKHTPFFDSTSVPYTITIGIEVDYVNTTILESVLNYILPVGWRYNIIFVKSFGWRGNAEGTLGNAYNIVGGAIETTNTHGGSYGYIPTAEIRNNNPYSTPLENELIGATDMGYVQNSADTFPVFILTQETRDDGSVSTPIVSLQNGNELSISDPADIAEYFVLSIEQNGEEIQTETVYIN